MRIILGVGAGIAAYKSCELLRLLTESGHQVRVVPTPASLRFVGEATWAALSGEPAATSTWTDVHDVPHVRLGQSADLVFVTPATADLLARAAAGMSDGLLTAVLLTARCPVVFAPAMHTEMWEHPATRANVAVLRQRGALVLEPAAGRLTGADSGPGRLPEPAELFRTALRVLARGGAGLLPDLAGRRVVVSAGGTREELDPVRFLGNWSSGRQGYALARTAAARGADVTLVAANVALDDPAGVKVVHVTSASEMRDAVRAAAADADAVIMAAAVADYRPAARSAEKIKKTGAVPAPVSLVENPDILRELVASRAGHGQVIVGFGAETGDLLANGRAKLAAKGCDLLVVNQVGGGLGFATDDNEAIILGLDGTEAHVPRGPKEALADAIWDQVASRWPASAKGL
jgi:phosphopantothenoylcysteine decarboxylase / phosphopantothenate---cysteine ligase